MQGLGVVLPHREGHDGVAVAVGADAAGAFLRDHDADAGHVAVVLADVPQLLADADDAGHLGGRAGEGRLQHDALVDVVVNIEVLADAVEGVDDLVEHADGAEAQVQLEVATDLAAGLADVVLAHQRRRMQRPGG